MFSLCHDVVSCDYDLWFCLLLLIGSFHHFTPTQIIHPASLISDGHWCASAALNWRCKSTPQWCVEFCKSSQCTKQVQVLEIWFFPPGNSLSHIYYSQSINFFSFLPDIDFLTKL